MRLKILQGESWASLNSEAGTNVRARLSPFTLARQICKVVVCTVWQAHESDV